MKNILYKLWHYSPAQIIGILKNKMAVSTVVPDLELDPLELARLQAMPRYAEGETKFLGKSLNFIDASSYLAMLEEIFVKQNYDFIALNNQPYIIDCGSNIGISVIYFKTIYPQAKIVGFEPDRKAFMALEKNLKSFGYDDVKIYNKAVWSSDATLDFQVEGSWGGMVSGEPNEKTIKVESQRLKDLLIGSVDFLKIDIEGGETEVLEDCVAELRNVKNLFVEYHSSFGKTQTLDKILSIITSAGMRYHIKEAAKRSKPFVNKVLSGFDSQLEIYAYRD